MLIPVLKDRTEKPPFGTPLRTDGHWSVQGLVGAWAFNEGAGLSAFGLPAAQVVTQGSLSGGLRLENSLDRTAGVTFPWNTFPGLTIVYGYQRTVASPSGFRRIFESSGANESLWLYPNTRAWQTLNYTNYWTFASGFNTVHDDGRYHTTALVTDWVNYGDGYVDGVQYAGVKTGTPAAPASSALRIGSNSATRQPAGVFSHAYIYSRALSPAEIAALSANPWQIYEPEVVWIEVGGGGGPILQSLLGSFPAPSGALSIAVVFHNYPEGSLPAPSGSIVKSIGKGLSGDLPAASGSLVKHTSVTRQGNMPAPSATVAEAVTFKQAVSGAMGSITAILTTVLNPLPRLRRTLGIIGARIRRIIGG